MKLISKAHILVRSGTYWVGFNEFGKYCGLEPYIRDPKKQQEIIQEAIRQGQRLAHRLEGRDG